MWSDIGFLRNLGARDAAGSGVVHLTGGFSGTKKYIYSNLNL